MEGVEKREVSGEWSPARAQLARVQEEMAVQTCLALSPAPLSAHSSA